MTKLFLDDIRHPPGTTWWKRVLRFFGFKPDGWVVVRSYGAFRHYMETHPVPEFLSLDHDLGPGQLTGMACAKWLVGHRVKGFEFVVHSANPPGKLNIECLLNNWLDFCKSGMEMLGESCDY